MKNTLVLGLNILRNENKQSIEVDSAKTSFYSGNRIDVAGQ